MKFDAVCLQKPHPIEHGLDLDSIQLNEYIKLRLLH